MAYTKQRDPWVDGTGGGTLIRAQDLNGIESGIAATATVADAALPTSSAAELIRDTMGTALVAGSNITITPNDGADTITIAATGGGSSTASYVRVTQSSGQSVSNTTVTELLWNTETEDVDGYHSTSSNTGRFTVPTGMGGVFMISTIIKWSSAMASAWTLNVYKNAAGIGVEAVAPGGADSLPFTTVLRLAAGDYIDLRVWQQEGASKTISTANSFFAATRIGA